MTEAGQPGAATPGEHGDGTGRQDDLARSASGWAPPATGWSRSADGGREPGLGWRPADGGWAASSPRHGDLPATLPGLPVEAPPARVNGHPHVNGVPHAGEESPVSRQAPVSAPPAEEQARDTGGDRPVVPAQRSAPGPERPPAEAEPGRHSSDDPPAPRAARWAEGGVPSSAPPALQVPPVGAAASGFEVPPGFHAPTVDRSAAEPSPGRSAAEPAPISAGDWAAAEPQSGGRDWAAAEPASGPDWAAAAEPPLARDWADRFPPEPSAAEAPRFAGPPHPAEEPEWSGPSWNRPSWGGGWAPPWSREEEPAGRPGPDRRSAEWAPEPSRPYEPVQAEQSRPYEPVRAEPVGSYEPPRPAPMPAPEPSRAESTPPYEPSGAEPSRAEPTGPYRPSRADRSGPYEPRDREPAAPYESRDRRPGAAYELRDREPGVPYESRDREPAAAHEPVRRAESYEPGRPGYEVTPRDGVERPAWAGAPTATPFSAPPVGAPSAPREAPAPSYAPPREPATAARSAEQERPVAPFRLRPVTGDAVPVPVDAAGDPPAATGPALVPATSGASRTGRPTAAPAPTSAPPYAARRSVPDPAPAEPVAAGAEDRNAAVLPQRVPAEPDVPVVPEPPAVEPSAETPELARIATHLRREDEPAPLRERPEGFDVNAILDAVREVAGVRDAALRRTPAGAHSLRLDLADGADPAEVSRQVARLLQDRMGLAAAPQNLPGMPDTPPPPVRRRSAEPRPAQNRTAESRAAENRTAENRAAENRAPESRPGDDRIGESRLGAPRDAEGRRARESRPEPAPEQPSPARAVETRPEVESPRRRRPTHRGRAAVDEPSLIAAPAGTPTGSPATVGTSYSGGQVTTTETAPSRPLDTGGTPGPRVVIDHVQVSTFGLDATVEVRLIAGEEIAEGHSTGPAVDGYVLRLCAVAAAAAVDELLRGAPQASDRGRCFVEHAAVVPFGNCEVATVVVLLVCEGWVEQLAGSALVAGDPRQAVVRATLAAVNRRLEALLS